MKMNAALSLAVVAVLSLSLGNTVYADQPPDNVQGNWTIYSTSVKDGSVEIKHVQITQSGNHITGYFEGPIQSGPIQGEINGHRIRFDTVTRTVLHFAGDVFGDTMSGTYGIQGKRAPWQATRPATIPTPVPASNGATYQTQPVVAAPATQTVYQAPAQTYQTSTPAYSTSQTLANPTTSYAAQTNPAPAPRQGPTPAPLSPDQLDSLVAPIALYPDALVAQVLAAATNPEQVAYADDWLAQNGNLTGPALAQAVDQQSWDPSVKALTQFPSVLNNLAHNLSWSSSLGQAFANQQADVMIAVQVMRAKAQAAGTLQSTSQVTVTQPAANTIVIQPANPQVVYVPQYNPTVVYGAPMVVPLYVPPPLQVASVGLFYGTGITIGATIGGGWGGFGWGWHAWGLNWGCCGGGGSTTIIYNHNTYINNHTWNGGNYNGYHPWGGGAAGSQNHAWYGANGTFHPGGNYKPGEDTHYGPNGAYHPNGYYGPDGGWHEDKNAGQHQPNGGDNGNHGLIGGNGGVQHQGANGGGQMLAQNRDDNNRSGAEQNRSRLSGDGAANRMESNRGRQSMNRAPHEQGGGGRRGGGGGGGRRR
ncbi:MAG: DUF3300 domain-containing protein [Terriglobales bacterium]